MPSGATVEVKSWDNVRYPRASGLTSTVSCSCSVGSGSEAVSSSCRGEPWTLVVALSPDVRGGWCHSGLRLDLRSSGLRGFEGADAAAQQH